MLFQCLVLEGESDACGNTEWSLQLHAYLDKCDSTLNSQMGASTPYSHPNVQDASKAGQLGRISLGGMAWRG